MTKRLAYLLVVLILAVIALLSVIPASTQEPGFQGSTKLPASVMKQLNEASREADQMGQGCGAWAEVNSKSPTGYEVILGCPNDTIAELHGTR